MLPFLGVVIGTFPLALIGREPGQDLSLVAWSAVAFAVVAVLIVAVPWFRLPPMSRMTVVIGFCVAVSILRQSGGGGNAGYGGLLLLPIIWQAVYGRRRDVLMTVGAIILALAAPILLIGGAAYPVTEWRKVILSSMVYGLAGIVVSELVTRLTRSESVMANALDIGRMLSGEGDVRLRVCEAIARLTLADSVVLVELDGAARVRVTSSVGVDLPTVPVPLEKIPSITRHALVHQQAEFIPDLEADGRTDRDVQSLTHFRGVLVQPVVRSEKSLGVITVGWHRPRRRLSADVRLAVEVLANEAGIAIERADLIRRLERMARHDDLTGVLNRRAWDEVLQVEAARARRSRGSASVAIFDLDHFKRFNDERGHLAGDQLLVQAAAAWRAELRSIDVLARWGGEEFVVFLPGTEAAAAVDVLDRLRRATPLGQSFSAGVADVDGREAHELMRAADKALYAAKESGRNRTVQADPAPAADLPAVHP